MGNRPSAAIRSSLGPPTRPVNARSPYAYQRGMPIIKVVLFRPESNLADRQVSPSHVASYVPQLKRVDAELRKAIAEMFELMYHHQGIGLAANQVDLPYRVFILNTTGDAAAKDQEHVLINPTILKQSGNVEAEEGCLSFPEIYAPVRRAERDRRRSL